MDEALTTEREDRIEIGPESKSGGSPGGSEARHETHK
jgi:hypothetical protein